MFFNILADWKAAVSRKSRNPSFDQTLETLRAHSFDVAPYAEVADGVLVSKHGAGAVLVGLPRVKTRTRTHDAAIAFAAAPGVLSGGHVARLLDRGHQKFIKTPQFELPATATHLHAIHQFTEELKQLLGVVDLYNEALGTTSDLYVYDRLAGREAVQPTPQNPWEQAGGH